MAEELAKVIEMLSKVDARHCAEVLERVAKEKASTSAPVSGGQSKIY